MVFGHTYNEGHVFYLADILMQNTLVIITIIGTKAKEAVVIVRTFLFGTRLLESRYIFEALHQDHPES